MQEHLRDAVNKSSCRRLPVFFLPLGLHRRLKQSRETDDDYDDDRYSERRIFSNIIIYKLYKYGDEFEILHIIDLPTVTYLPHQWYLLLPKYTMKLVWISVYSSAKLDGY